jgi:hypothetical protein
MYSYYSPGTRSRVRSREPTAFTVSNQRRGLTNRFLMASAKWLLWNKNCMEQFLCISHRSWLRGCRGIWVMKDGEIRSILEKPMDRWWSSWFTVTFPLFYLKSGAAVISTVSAGWGEPLVGPEILRNTYDANVTSENCSINACHCGSFILTSSLFLHPKFFNCINTGWACVFLMSVPVALGIFSILTPN